MPKTGSALLPNIHSLSPQEFKALVRTKFLCPSRFQKEWDADWMDLDCADYSGQLRAEVIRLLRAKAVMLPGGKLEELHQHIPQALKDYNLVDGINKVTSYLYDTDTAFIQKYHRFIKEKLSSHFPYPFYFQATPTIRIHCPDSKNSEHYPRYHTDSCYGHPMEEINIWIPITHPIAPQHHGFRMTDLGNSRDVLTRFDFDFGAFVERVTTDKPFNYALDGLSSQVMTPLGKMRAFDARCLHTGEPLLHHTRASMDIRIVPVADYEKLTVEHQGTGRRKMHYVPGQGYHPLSSDRL